MRRLTTREIVLVSAVLAAGLIYLWIYSNRALSARDAGLGEDADAGRLADTAPSIPMDLLAQVVDDYDRHGRDLFQYAKPPMTQAEIDRLRRQREADDRRRQEAEDRRLEGQKNAANRRPKRPPPPPRQTDQGPQPPRIPFQYIGYLGEPSNRIAVFQHGEDQYIARKGEQVQDQFRVVEIRYESVVMGYTDPEFETRTRELPMTSE